MKTFGRILCAGRIGETITFLVAPIDNVEVGPGGYGYVGKTKMGKKIIDIVISPLKLEQGARVYLTDGKVNGDIMYEGDTNTAMALIKKETQRLIIAEIEKLKVSFNSAK